MKKYYWCEYDTDGTTEIYYTYNELMHLTHSILLGPFNTFTEAKNQLIWALQDCKDDIQMGINSIKTIKKENCKEFGQ